MESSTRIIHIAAISIPALSHQASLLEFCKRLVSLHPHFHITCIFPTVESPPAATLSAVQSLPPSIHHIFLPPIDKLHLPQHSPPAVQIQLALQKSLPSLSSTLKTLRFTPSPIVALITDPFANETLEIAKDLNLLSFVYFPHSSFMLSLFLNLPKLDREISCEYRDLQNPLEIIPGRTIPINGCDLPEHLQDRNSLSYELILNRCKRFHLADGFLINSFLEMEDTIITHLQQQFNVFPIGPITQSGSDSESGSDCVEWLDTQSPRLWCTFRLGVEGR